MSAIPLKRQVFISYAHADDEPLDEHKPGWVSYFVEKLKIAAGRQFGGASIEFWMDHRLEPQRSVNDELRSRIRESAVILALISPRYIESEWCQKEMATFIEVNGGVPADRVFLVELLPTERMTWHPAARDLSPVKLWYSSLTTQEPRTLGWPFPPVGEHPYWDHVHDLGSILARQLRALTAFPSAAPEQPPPAPPPPTPPATPPADGPLSIIISTDHSDTPLALDAQALLGDLDADATLDMPPAENEPPATYRANFEQQLRSSHGVIVVYGEAPRGWVQSKFGDVRKLLALERKGTWASVLEGPPEPKALHGLPPRGLMVLNCRQGISKDELSRFVQALRNGQNGAGASGAGRV